MDGGMLGMDKQPQVNSENTIFFPGQIVIYKCGSSVSMPIYWKVIQIATKVLRCGYYV